MQTRISAGPTSRFTARPFLATLFGIPVVAMVLAALTDASLPVVGNGRAAVIALWVLGAVMCSFGISAMRARFGIGRANLVGAPLGMVATALLLSALLGWTPLLQPIATALASSGPPVSPDRAAIVGVGAVMTVKWGIAWLSELPL